MSRLEEAEALLKKLLDQDWLKECGNTAPLLRDVDKFLNPCDWSSVKMGDTVKAKGLEDAIFIGVSCHDKVAVWCGDHAEGWSKEDCTPEPRLYSELVKHDWPVDGVKPEWVSLNDFVVWCNSNGGIHCSNNIGWKIKNKWFAVIKDE